jgi:urease gamma subunit
MLRTAIQKNLDSFKLTMAKLRKFFWQQNLVGSFAPTKRTQRVERKHSSSLVCLQIMGCCESSLIDTTKEILNETTSAEPSSMSPNQEKSDYARLLEAINVPSKAPPDGSEEAPSDVPDAVEEEISPDVSFKPAQDMIDDENESAAALQLQRIARGYLVRLQRKNQQKEQEETTLVEDTKAQEDANSIQVIEEMKEVKENGSLTESFSPDEPVAEKVVEEEEERKMNEEAVKDSVEPNLTELVLEQQPALSEPSANEDISTLIVAEETPAIITMDEAGTVDGSEVQDSVDPSISSSEALVLDPQPTSEPATSEGDLLVADDKATTMADKNEVCPSPDEEVTRLKIQIAELQANIKDLERQLHHSQEELADYKKRDEVNDKDVAVEEPQSQETSSREETTRGVTPPPSKHRKSHKRATSSHSSSAVRTTPEQQQILMEESGKMLEYLRSEVLRLRAENARLQGDLDSVSENTHRLVEAHQAAKQSFSSLTQHAQSERVKADEVALDYKQQVQKLQMELQEMKDELRMKKAAYVEEFHSRLQYQDAMAKIVDLVQDKCRDSRLVEQVLQLSDDVEENQASGGVASTTEATTMSVPVTPTETNPSVVGRFTSFFG